MRFTQQNEEKNSDSDNNEEEIHTSEGNQE